jgi:hypothetical protein
VDHSSWNEAKKRSYTNCFSFFCHEHTYQYEHSNVNEFFQKNTFAFGQTIATGYETHINQNIPYKCTLLSTQIEAPKGRKGTYYITEPNIPKVTANQQLIYLVLTSDDFGV